jgi:hypothetical protein
VLKVKLNHDPAPRISEELEDISSRLSQLWDFVELWDNAIRAFPAELHTLAPLIDSPSISVGVGKQNTLLTGASHAQKPKQHYNLLEKRILTFGFDRFLLSNLNIFMWRSFALCRLG